MRARTSANGAAAVVVLPLLLAACQPTPHATAPTPAAGPRPEAIAPLVDRFAARCGQCADAVYRLTLGRAAAPAARSHAPLQRSARATWHAELARCLTGEGYGGRPVLTPQTVTAWLAAPDCGRFARASFAGKDCLALQSATAGAYLAWERTARKPPAAPPRKKLTRRARPVARGGILGVLRVRMGKRGGLGLKGGSGGLGLRGRGTGGGSARGLRGHGLGGGGGGVTMGRVHQPKGQVRAGAAVIPPSLNPHVIRRVIRSHLRRIQFCYASVGLRVNPRLRGTVRIRFLIAPTGRVSSASVASTTLNHRRTEQCILHAVRTWRFPRPRHGSAVVTYPFVFKPQGP